VVTEHVEQAVLARFMPPQRRPGPAGPLRRRHRHHEADLASAGGAARTDRGALRGREPLPLPDSLSGF